VEQLVPDEVWDAIQPLLPPKGPRPKGGRPWIEDRAVLGGIVYVPRAGVPWRLLPARELGCGSGVTCWRRLRDWQAAGVWRPCIIGCWTGWATTARSTGPGRPSTA
jgi:transposase